MDVAEPADGIGRVAITRLPVAPVAVNGVGTEVDHTKRQAGGTEKEKTAVGGVDEGVDPVGGVFGHDCHSDF